MNVAQVVWWWETGWMTWAREHGVHVDEDRDIGPTPDKAAFRFRYGGGKVISR